MKFWLVALMLAVAQNAFSQAEDKSAHQAQIVYVSPNVRLEVLDWGGSGRALVLLPSMNGTAHQFDELAPKLANQYHVYAITRRGIGASSPADDGYEADRLADDVMAVIDSLKLQRPVVLGVDFAAGELSSIGSRYSEKIAGLIYVDGVHLYAYYTPKRQEFFDEIRWHVDVAELQRKLARLVAQQQESNPEYLEELLKKDLPEIVKDLEDRLAEFRAGRLKADPNPTPPPVPSAQWKRSVALMAGVQKHTAIRARVLALQGFTESATRERPQDLRAAGAKAFQEGNPSARVVLIPQTVANHELWRTNEAEVLREIRAFIGSLQ